MLPDAGRSMNSVLTAWNLKFAADAIAEVLACCGSRVWATGVVVERPYRGEDDLREAADAVWWSLGERDWLEAFACHPQIGERVDGDEPAAFAKWSRQEQSLVGNADEQVIKQISDGNREYAARFGFTYIVCATGKSAEEMLDILNHRLHNGRTNEIREAAEQQRQITQLRLGKWMHG
jgi:2-oxo-4-hydroxy-4-carboxy-5-ureidoimidazoline decarboxylase